MVETRRRRISFKEERKLEQVERVLSSIRELDSDSCLLVEGKRDREALRKLGVKGEIFCLLTGKGSMSERLEKISAKRVYVLVDFDPKGESLARVVAHLLAKRGRITDLSVWRKLKSYLKRDARDIEGLATYILRRSIEAR